MLKFLKQRLQFSQGERSATDFKIDQLKKNKDDMVKEIRNNFDIYDELQKQIKDV